MTQKKLAVHPPATPAQDAERSSSSPAQRSLAAADRSDSQRRGKEASRTDEAASSPPVTNRDIINGLYKQAASAGYEKGRARDSAVFKEIARLNLDFKYMAAHRDEPFDRTKAIKRSAGETVVTVQESDKRGLLFHCRDKSVGMNSAGQVVPIAVERTVKLGGLIPIYQRRETAEGKRIAVVGIPVPGLSRGDTSEGIATMKEMQKTVASLAAKHAREALENRQSNWMPGPDGTLVEVRRATAVHPTKQRG